MDETVRSWLPQAEQDSSTPRIPRPETDAELADFFLTYLGIKFPNVSVCPGHSNPWAAVCDAYFARAPVVVWKASRGYGGKTFTMGALAFAEALTLRASVTLLGGSAEQSRRVLAYLREFWDRPSAPKWALASDPTAARASMVWGNQVVALMASMTSVSGPHPQRLRIDEVDLVDLPLLDQSLGQPMSKDGIKANVLLSSAHYEPDGTLTEVMKRARAQGHPIHEWCWRETVKPLGWTDPEDIVRQKATVTALMWATQYDLQEPTAQGRAIDPEKVERMFIGAVIHSPVVDEFPYREFEPPVDGASYATGADWARVSDFVEIVTFRDDIFPLRMVAYQRFRKRATPYIVAAFEHQTTRFPGTSAHDATSMGGQIMSDLIGGAPGAQSAPEGVVMAGLRRRALFSSYIVAIEQEEIIAPRVDLFYRQHKFVRNEDLFGVGHPPDGVVAGAMAYHASAASTVPIRMINSTEVRPKSPDQLKGFSRVAAYLAPLNERVQQEIDAATATIRDPANLYPCANPICVRVVGTALYCCAGCSLAHQGGYEIHETGMLAHSHECTVRARDRGIIP